MTTLKRLFLLLTLLSLSTMNTALAAHWITLSSGTDKIPSVSFDADSMQRSVNNLYFWEKIQRSNEDYQIRLAKVGLTDFDFADAEVVQKTSGQNIVFMHPHAWDEHGTSLHPLRLAWMDKVLAQLNSAKKIDNDIILSKVEAPTL